MSIEEYDDDLATQYAMARRDRPDLDEGKLAEVIVSRLSRDQLMHYAEEALAWASEPGDRRALAQQYVQNFILAMEADPDEAPQ